MKDNFSIQAGAYASFRPGYPQSLVDFLLANTPVRNAAWDCGTGNGQLAAMLAPHFARVEATDISAAQLAKAKAAPNIHYREVPAEQTDFMAHSFDLITVAQAIHWFRFDEFYAEVRRTLKPHGLFAAAGYGLVRLTPEIDAVTDHFYTTIIGPYWDAERRYVDEAYRTIPFPFEELEAPALEQCYEWEPKQLLGYFSTWSATQHYIKAKGSDPVDLIRDEVYTAWGAVGQRSARIPILLRAGRLK